MRIAAITISTVMMVLVATVLLPGCTTSEEAATVATPPSRLAVLSVAELVEYIARGGGDAGRGLAEKLDKKEGGTVTASLRRGLNNILEGAPRLHVAPHRRSLSPHDFLRLEVEETGHAVTVSRAHLHRQRQRSPGRTRAGVDDGHMSLLSTTTYHRYKSVTASYLLDNCTARALAKTSSDWNLKSYNLISHAVGGTTQIIAVVVTDPDNYKKEQWVTDEKDRNTESVTVDYKRVGFSIVRYDYRLGGGGNLQWTSGSGAIGYVDGKHDEATFSDRITSVSWYPSCSATDWFNKKCSPARGGPGRPNFYQPTGGTQWIYVADSGNCRVRLVDYTNGLVKTRWGKDCLNETAKDDMSQYKDSPISSRNVLGSDLAVIWVGWKLLLVVDRDANRIRKFVTSQHQGLSELAGAYNSSACHNASHVDGTGLEATFCRPETVTVSADGSRVVVVEAVEQYSSHDAGRRIRVLDLHYSYLPGGDVADVTCTVRTLRRMSLTTPGNSVLWSRSGNMVLSPNGRVLLAGSVDPYMLNYKWDKDYFNTGGDSFVVALSLDTGQIRLLQDVDGVSASIYASVNVLTVKRLLWGALPP